MNLAEAISWCKWVKTNQNSKENEEHNMYCNIEKVKKTGTLRQLLDETYNLIPEFLDHEYIKLNQARSSRQMILKANEQNSDTS